MAQACVFVWISSARALANPTRYSSTPTGFPSFPSPTPGLHQSCRHVVRSWANQSFGAHLHNMTLTNGKLRVPQDGRYYLYSQVGSLIRPPLQEGWPPLTRLCPLSGLFPLPVPSGERGRPAQREPPAGSVRLQEDVLPQPHPGI